MLSLNFFSENGQSAHSIRVVDDFYEWLARSEFAQLGRSQIKTIELDGEMAELPLVPLEPETRSKLVDFLSETIFQETRSMLGALEQSMPQPELTVQTYRLKKLLEMLDCTKNRVYQYLQCS
jgi:hypothetical protein